MHRTWALALATLACVSQPAATPSGLGTATAARVSLPRVTVQPAPLRAWARGDGPLTALPIDGPRELRCTTAEGCAAYELAHGPVTERWEDLGFGVEQTFEVRALPAGSGPIHLHLDAGNADVRPTARGVRLESPDGTAIRVGIARAWDARGRALPAHLIVGDNTLTLTVEADDRTPLPLRIDPLYTPAEDILRGVQANERFGSSAIAVDLDGDGDDELLVGAPYRGTSRQGALESYFGGTGGLGVTPGWTEVGANPFQRSGDWLRPLGDVTADGVDDVLLTAESSSTITVRPGDGAGGLAAPILTWSPPQLSTRLGVDAGVGDLDGDGLPDLVASDDGANRVHILWGTGIGTWDTTTPLILEQPIGAFGQRLEVGDVDGDGIDDLVVSASEVNSLTGRASVWLGKPQASWQQTPDLTQDGTVTFSAFTDGLTLTDIEGDGIQEILIGAPLTNTLGVGTGFAGIYRFTPSALELLATVDSPGTFTGHGELFAAGDVDADGLSDVVVMANTPSQPWITLLLGRDPLTSGFDQRFQLDVLRGGEPPTQTSMGDFNGDGEADLIVPVPGADGIGAVVVYRGISGTTLPDADGDGVLFGDDCDPDDPAVLGPITYSLDNDGDGIGATQFAVSCSPPTQFVPSDLGFDCDNADATTFPGADERCDGKDNDCDGDVDENPVDPVIRFVDADGDGYGSTPESVCSGAPGYVEQNGDCDDAAADQFPGAIEQCDGIDQDCDALVDNGVADRAWYADADGDGYGDPAVFTQGCIAPSGSVANSTDCDDTRADRSPGVPEVCDAANLDEDCDGDADDLDVDVTDPISWYADADADGLGGGVPATRCDADAVHTTVTAGDCDDTDPAVGAGTVYFIDADRDGYGAYPEPPRCDTPSPVEPLSTVNGDCNDFQNTIHPGVPEACDGVDNDCDGRLDPQGFIDADGDGYGDPARPQDCAEPRGGDCDDADPARSPGAFEVDGDDIDQDCDGLLDAPVADTPVEDTPVEDTPVEDTPVEDTPADTPSDDTPSDDTSPGDEPKDGCGCAQPSAPAPLALVLFGIAALRRRRNA
jgi:MYXO-CTERM domain-containing protein